MINCTIFEIGNHVLYHLQNIIDHSYLHKFKNILISFYDKENYLHDKLIRNEFGFI